MKLASCRRTGDIDVIDVPVPEAGPGDILVRLTACGVCGTDLMKVYDPNTPKPVQLGHEIAGVVAAVGAGVEGFAVGQRVAVAHHAPDPTSHFTRRGSATQDPAFKASNITPGGFAEVIRVPAQLVPHTVVAIPDHVPDLRAAFMEPLACCLRALSRVPVQAGDTAVIIGAGAIGLLFVPLLNARGATVAVSDAKSDRLETALQWGASLALPAGDGALVEGVKALSHGRGADVVILTVTTPATLSLAMDLLRDGGTLIPFGVKPGPAIALDMWSLYRREISLVTSYSATPQGLGEAMTLLSGPGFELERTITTTVPLERAAQGFALLHSGKASKVVIVNS
jgi:L-iditol 2-dehydrogenase